MPRRTNPFQQLTASILATIHAPDYIVEESVLELNKKTGLPREIDIKITEKANPNNKILVECRDHSRKQDVTWIDSLDGKARSLGFPKVVAVSSSGFYKTTLKEAASRGIETLHLKEAKEIEWRKWLFALSEFGLEMDYKPIVKDIRLVTASKIDDILKGLSPKDLFFVNLNTKTHISLSKYIDGLVKDPKIVNYIRGHNKDNATTHYKYEIPCDPGVGLGLPGDKFVPLTEVVFSLDSLRRSEKVKLKHISIGGKKIMIGTPKITGPNSKLILEERPGQLMETIEQKGQFIATFYSTFITGTQEIVKKALGEEIKDIKIDLLLDGLVVYKTEESIEKVKQIRFLNNSFLLFFSSEDKLTAQQLIKKVIEKPSILPEIRISGLKDMKSFRVIASQENQIVSIDKKLQEKVEGLLSNKLKLEVNRALPDIEVWFLSRSEGLSLVGLRITKKPNYEKTLHKGELRPELAHIMCLLAELKSTDVVLDPFAGYGAIPLECAKSFSVKRIIAGEKDSTAFKVLQEKMKKPQQKIVLGKWNALKLGSLSNNFVDKIVTDPPWGIYGKQIQDLEAFYNQMVTEFIRLTKPMGIMVILTSQKEIFEKLIKKFSSLDLEAKYDILVSGKKAAIYKIRRLQTGNKS